jgi:hypothetical protein
MVHLARPPFLVEISISFVGEKSLNQDTPREDHAPRALMLRGSARAR